MKTVYTYNLMRNSLEEYHRLLSKKYQSSSIVDKALIIKENNFCAHIYLNDENIFQATIKASTKEIVIDVGRSFNSLGVVAAATISDI